MCTRPLSSYRFLLAVTKHSIFTTRYTLSTIPASGGVAKTIQEISEKHMPACGLSTHVYSVNIKSKVLLSCEKAFSRVIPDNQLGSIITVNDVLQFFESPQQSPGNPHSLFPSLDIIRSQGELPQNLSFPEVAASVQKRKRKPFQNFDSPEHTKFLTKQQREARKKKRRHLTAWK